jgi:hypothetical protein
MRALIIAVFTVLLASCSSTSNGTAIKINEIDTLVKSILPMGYETLGITKSISGDTNSYSIEYTYNHLDVEAIPVAVTSKIGVFLDGIGHKWNGSGSGFNGYSSHIKRSNADRTLIINAYAFKKIKENTATILVVCIEIIR